MKELTEKAALDWSLKLWKWIAETGSEDKADWPEWEKWIKQYDSIPCSLCPCCAYALQILIGHGKSDLDNEKCGYCPVKKWGRFNTCITDQFMGLFDKWEDAWNSEPERIRCAEKIVKAIRLARSKLNRRVKSNGSLQKVQE